MPELLTFIVGIFVGLLAVGALALTVGTDSRSPEPDARGWWIGGGN